MKILKSFIRKVFEDGSIPVEEFYTYIDADLILSSEKEITLPLQELLK